MKDEKQNQKPASSPAPAAPSVVAGTPAITGPAPFATVVAGLTPEQFTALQKTLAYGIAMAGLLFNKGSLLTPTAKNTELVKAFGDLVLEHVNAD